MSRGASSSSRCGGGGGGGGGRGREGLSEAFREVLPAGAGLVGFVALSGVDLAPTPGLVEALLADLPTGFAGFAGALPVRDLPFVFATGAP